MSWRKRQELFSVILRWLNDAENVYTDNVCVFATREQKKSIFFRLIIYDNKCVLQSSHYHSHENEMKNNVFSLGYGSFIH